MKKVKSIFLIVFAIMMVVVALHYSKPVFFDGGNDFIDPIPLPFTVSVDL